MQVKIILTGGIVRYTHVKRKVGISFDFDLSPLTLAGVTSPTAPLSECTVFLSFRRHMYHFEVEVRHRLSTDILI